MKRLFLLPLLLLASTVSLLAAEWTDGNGVTWSFEQTYLSYVTPSRLVYSITGAVGIGSDLAVPETVYDGDTPCTIESISNSAFKDNATITSVTLPSTIKEIGAVAFRGCSMLTEVTNLNKVKYIALHAFSNCSSLTSVDISACEQIGSSAFSSCSNLTTVTSLSNCKSIGEHSFYSCSKLQAVNIGDDTTIGSFAFCDCRSLQSVGSLKNATIGEYAFISCVSLAAIDLSQVASIATSAFQGCTGLTTVGDLSALTAIAEGTFNGCTKLESVNLRNARLIGRNSFLNCSSLSELSLPAVQQIGQGAFSGCTNLHDINIASTELASIGDDAFSSIGVVTLLATTPATLGGSNAFGQQLLIRVPDASVEAYRAADVWSDIKSRIVGIGTQIDFNVNTTAKTNLSALSEAIGEDKLSQVVSLTVSGSINGYDIMVMRNKMDRLNHLDLSAATIVANDYEYYTGYHTSDNVLGDYSFYQMDKLFDVKLPNSITAIGNYAFYGCSNLKTVTFYSGIETIGDYAFAYCHNMTSLELPDGLKSIGNVAFSRVAAKNIVLPNGLESIGQEAFYNNTALQTIALPSTLKTIGAYAFQDCSSLMSISLPTCVEQINAYTFRRCTSLTEARIPSTITAIGTEAFSGCTQLNDVYTYIAEPTPITMTTFSTYTSATLHVPTTSYNTYWYDTEWSQFRTLQEFDAEYEYFYINKDFTIDDEKGIIQGEGDNDPDADINAGGGLIVETKTDSQDLDDLHIKDDGTQSGSVIADDNITANTLYFDIQVKAGRWYFLSFPFSVRVTNIVAPGSYVFRSYDGGHRAEHGSGGWKNHEGDRLLPGVGYIFQTNKTGTLSLWVEKADMDWRADGHSHSLQANASANQENAGWNFVGNPFTSYFDINKMGLDAPITRWNGSSYEALRPGDDDYFLQPFESFFVQKPDAQSAIDFSSDGRYTYRQTQTQQRRAAKRRLEQGVNAERLIVNLTLTDGTTSDKTRVVYNEQCTADYDNGKDAAKFLSSEQVPQLYTMNNGNTRYAINERPLGNVAIGYRACRAGNLTIAAVRADQPVRLYDRLLGISHDLSVGAYTFSTQAGSFDQRFTLTTDNSATSIAQLRQQTGVSVMAAEKGMMLTGIDAADVNIYTLSGAMVASHVGNGFVSLPQAAYIVKVKTADKASDMAVKLLVR